MSDTFKNSFDSFKGQYWKGKIYSLKDFDSEQYQEAVRKAWADMFPITINGISSFTKKDKEHIIKKLAEALIAYFKDTAKNDEAFDEFHKILCNKIIGKFDNCNIALSHGKAQKLVNMSFKYLYCFEDKDDYEEHFRFCHMPLDKYTLLWFGEKTGCYYFGWSNMECGLYYAIQNYIRRIIAEDGTADSVLKEEFIIWKKMKNSCFELKNANQEELKNDIESRYTKEQNG